MRRGRPPGTPVNEHPARAPGTRDPTPDVGDDPMAVFVGLDWGGEAHAVCVVDAKGAVRDRFAAGHDRDGLQALIARLAKWGAPRTIPIAIERPSGLLIDALAQAGFSVTPLHPNLVKACRPRYRAVAAKSDP